MPLTDTAVRQAKPAAKDYTLTDADGLSLFVATNGTKSWHFRFRLHEKQSRLSLGTYPELSLRDARAARDEYRTLVAKGIDPRLERRQSKQAASAQAVTTFEYVAERWYEFKSPRLTDGRKGSAAQSRRYLDKDILPMLGKLPIAEVKRSDVLATVRRVEKRDALNVAEKIRTWLNQIFRFAIAEGFIENNPASDLDIVAAQQPPVKHNPILREAELPELLVRLADYKGSMLTKAGVRLLMLTGVRTIELRKASPEQFDLQEEVWRVPADNVKQLRSSVRTESGEIPPYIVPLSRQALLEVRELLKVTGRCRYLLPGRNDPSKMMSENTLNGAIKRMGFAGKLTGHGIRGTISTALNEKGYNSDWVEAQLSHAGDNKVRRAYNHAEYVEQRRKMMQDWADLLDELEARGRQAGA